MTEPDPKRHRPNIYHDVIFTKKMQQDLMTRLPFMMYPHYTSIYGPNPTKEQIERGQILNKEFDEKIKNDLEYMIEYVVKKHANK